MRSLAAAPRLMPALAALVAVVAVGCYRVDAPPMPQAERIPTIAGEIVQWDAPNDRYVLADGQVVEVQHSGAGTDPTRLGDDTGAPPGLNGPRGGLILAGEDGLGHFWAASKSWADGGCFGIRGPGYLQLDRDRVLLSSGLVLKLAHGFNVTNDRPDSVDRTWLLSFDDICLNESGEVTSIHQGALGA